MNIQPITDYRCYTSTSCTYDRGKTPQVVNIPKSPMEVKNQDKFELSEKSVPDKNVKKVNPKIGLMYSSGGGTN